MKTKDQTPQNPEKKKEQVQEENSTSVQKQDETKIEANSEKKKKPEVSLEEKKSAESPKDTEQKTDIPETATVKTKDSKNLAIEKADDKPEDSKSPKVKKATEKTEESESLVIEKADEKTEDSKLPKIKKVTAKTKKSASSVIEKTTDIEEESKTDDTVKEKEEPLEEKKSAESPKDTEQKTDIPETATVKTKDSKNLAIEKADDKPEDSKSPKVKKATEKTEESESLVIEKADEKTEDSKLPKIKEVTAKTKKSASSVIEKTADIEEESKTDDTVKKKEEPLEEKKEDTPQPKEKNINADLKEEVSTDEDGNDNDEHEEDHDEEQHQEEIDYDSSSKDELIAYLKSTVNEGEINKIKKKIALIKVAFLKNIKDSSDKAYEQYLKDGGDENDYRTEDDPLLGKFNEIFNIYKKKRSDYLKEQDKIKIENLEAKKLILEELKTLIDSEETLKKTYDEFKTLQEKWKEIGMVPKGEVNNLWQSYHFYVEKFFDKVKINRELRDLDMKKNLELKIQLCEKTEELLLESSIIKSFKQLQLYHQQWKEVGPVVQDKKDEIWERFKDTTNKINQRRREHYNNLQEEQSNNLTAKTALCEKIEELIQDELTTMKEWQAKTAEVTDLLKVWKTIGPAPRKQNDEIWSRFKSSLDTFFSGKKEYFQKIKDEQLNNYNLKLDLCVQAEALQSSTDWRNTTRDLIALQKGWKELGPVPRKHSDKIWKRFRAACDIFFNSKSDYFSNINKHEADNLKLKTELIKKVGSYKFGDDKNENLNAIKEFQREWTTIGHVPMKEKDKMHNEFRNAINLQLDQLNISKTEIQTMNYKSKVDSFRDNPNSKRIISSERTYLFNKRKKMEEEINLWENNLGFFAESKQASLLKEEFEKKIEKAKRDIEIINAKMKMLDKESNGH